MRGGAGGDGDLQRQRLPRVHGVDGLDALHQVLWRGQADEGEHLEIQNQSLHPGLILSGADMRPPPPEVWGVSV